MLPFSHSHVPEMYYLAWLLAVAMMAAAPIRWYFGLEWVLWCRKMFFCRQFVEPLYQWLRFRLV